MAFHACLALGRAYISITYLSSEIYLIIFLDKFLTLVGQRKVIHIRSHLPLRSLPILQVFYIPFWTSFRVPSVLNKVITVLYSHCPLIQCTIEKYSNLHRSVSSLFRSLLGKCWFFFAITLFRSTSFLLSVNNSSHSASWAYGALIFDAFVSVLVIKDYYGLTIL